MLGEIFTFLHVTTHILYITIRLSNKGEQALLLMYLKMLFKQQQTVKVTKIGRTTYCDENGYISPYVKNSDGVISATIEPIFNVKILIQANPNAFIADIGIFVKTDVIFFFVLILFKKIKFITSIWIEKSINVIKHKENS